MIMPPPKPSKKMPRKPFAVEVLERLPLAESFYLVWRYLATDAVLQELFEQQRGRCYQDQLTFAQLVGLLADALTRYRGSGHRAIVKAAQRQQLATQTRAVYGKLARVPLPLAEAFLACLTARLRPLLPAGRYHTELPASLRDLAVVVLDGKKIKKAAKRLLVTRGRPGKLFGGKLLVAYLPAAGLAVAMAADPDGEANDIRLVPRALPLARAAVPGPRLWVADRQFCDRDQAARFRAEGDHFLVRYTKRNGFTADPDQPARTGTDAAGRTFTEEWGWMGGANDGRRCRVRRLTLERPGQEAIVLVTDLLDADGYPGADLLAVYWMRWQIENVFQQITEVFALDHLIGCTPQATVFQASLCLVIYNVLQVIRGAIAAGRPEPTAMTALSSEKIFLDLHEELLGLHRTLPDQDWLRWLQCPSNATALGARLQALLSRAWTPEWWKAVNQKQRPHPAPAKQSGAHTSVHKLLEQAKKKPQNPEGRASP